MEKIIPGTERTTQERSHLGTNTQFRTKSDWTFQESYLDSDKFLLISFVSSKQQFLSIRSGVTGIRVEIENSTFSGWQIPNWAMSMVIGQKRIPLCLGPLVCLSSSHTVWSEVTSNELKWTAKVGKILSILYLLELKYLTLREREREEKE